MTRRASSPPTPPARVAGIWVVMAPTWSFVTRTRDSAGFWDSSTGSTTAADGTSDTAAQVPPGGQDDRPLAERRAAGAGCPTPTNRRCPGNDDFGYFTRIPTASSARSAPTSGGRTPGIPGRRSPAPTAPPPSTSATACSGRRGRGYGWRVTPAEGPRERPHRGRPCPRTQLLLPVPQRQHRLLVRVGAAHMGQQPQLRRPPRRARPVDLAEGGARLPGYRTDPMRSGVTGLPRFVTVRAGAYPSSPAWRRRAGLASRGPVLRPRDQAPAGTPCSCGGIENFERRWIYPVCAARRRPWIRPESRSAT